MNQLHQPIAQPPYPLEGYGVPDSAQGLLPWEFVSNRMQTAPNYWVCTINPDGTPHSRPVWGVWRANTVFFGGGPNTRWFRNLKANPIVSIHLDDSNEAVIFEGHVTLVQDQTLMTQLDDLYEVKYKMRHGPPLWQLHADRVLAWRSMQTMTKFTFA